jgi:death-on-curing protein
MIRYLTEDEVLELHEEGILLYGGSPGVRSYELIDSALAQPQATFGGQDLFPTVIDKAAALGFSLIANHGFVDGNKRVGFAALDVFLRLNGYRIQADLNDAEAITLSVASGSMSREELTHWVLHHAVPHR